MCVCLSESRLLPSEALTPIKTEEALLLPLLYSFWHGRFGNCSSKSSLRCKPKWNHSKDVETGTQDYQDLDLENKHETMVPKPKRRHKKSDDSDYSADSLDESVADDETTMTPRPKRHKGIKRKYKRGTTTPTMRRTLTMTVTTMTTMTLTRVRHGQRGRARTQQDQCDELSQKAQLTSKHWNASYWNCRAPWRNNSKRLRN